MSGELPAMDTKPSPSTKHGDSNIDFEEHITGRVSKLETHRAEISKMRERSWPYKRIAKWLGDERGVQVSAPAVRSFCIVRNIIKGVGELRRRPQNTNPKPRRGHSQSAADTQPSVKAADAQEEEVFDFDEKKSLETWKSRTGHKNG